MSKLTNDQIRAIHERPLEGLRVEAFAGLVAGGDDGLQLRQAFAGKGTELKELEDGVHDLGLRAVELVEQNHAGLVEGPR